MNVNTQNGAPRVLRDLNFNEIINDYDTPMTATGAALLNNYRSSADRSGVTCQLVNNFVKEAAAMTYDNIINSILIKISDFINDNKVSWALASACESINANQSRYNFINRAAASQVSNLLEMKENDVVTYIKAGALKNIMFCEYFRNIAKSVFKERLLIEAAADYAICHPVSITETVPDECVYFVVERSLYRYDIPAKTITEEKDWNKVSNTFKVINNILSSPQTVISESDITVNVAGCGQYTISESGKCVRKSYKTENISEMTVEELRENNKMLLMAISPTHKNSIARQLESVALIAENYDNILDFDNINIYTTKNDRFLVIESGPGRLYAKLLRSNHTSPWLINENTVNALSYIKTKTNVSLTDRYDLSMNEAIRNISEEEVNKIDKNLRDEKINGLRARVETLTEKYKNNPVMLAVLANLASQINDAQ